MTSQLIAQSPEGLGHVVVHGTRGDIHHVGNLVVSQVVEPTEAKRLAAPLGQVINPLAESVPKCLRLHPLVGGWRLTRGCVFVMPVFASLCGTAPVQRFVPHKGVEQ